MNRKNILIIIGVILVAIIVIASVVLFLPVSHKASQHPAYQIKPAGTYTTHAGYLNLPSGNGATAFSSIYASYYQVNFTMNKSLNLKHLITTWKATNNTQVVVTAGFTGNYSLYTYGANNTPLGNFTINPTFYSPAKAGAVNVSLLFADVPSSQVTGYQGVNNWSVYFVEVPSIAPSIASGYAQTGLQPENITLLSPLEIS